jgi:excisionase family DNA binding protein
MTQVAGQQDRGLTPAEVARLYRVDPKTVTRWAKAGRLTFYWTLGGHRRYPESQILAQLAELTHTREE